MLWTLARQPYKHFPLSATGTQIIEDGAWVLWSHLNEFHLLFCCQTIIHIHTFESELTVTLGWKVAVVQFITSQLTHLVSPLSPPLSSTPAWFTMTTESGADSEAKQPQENKETEKGNSKAAEPASPERHPEQFPAAVGHSTPAKKEQVRLFVTRSSLFQLSAWIQWKCFTFSTCFKFLITLYKTIISLNGGCFYGVKSLHIPFMSGLNFNEHDTPFMLNEWNEPLCETWKWQNQNTDELSVLNGCYIPTNLSWT